MKAGSDIRDGDLLLNDLARFFVKTGFHKVHREAQKKMEEPN
jgi:hypothetical protein